MPVAIAIIISALYAVLIKVYACDYKLYWSINFDKKVTIVVCFWCDSCITVTGKSWSEQWEGRSARCKEAVIPERWSNVLTLTSPSFMCMHDYFNVLFRRYPWTAVRQSIVCLVGNAVSVGSQCWQTQASRQTYFFEVGD